MTNHWVDMKNTDVAMIIGSNAAENHPMSFKWLQEGRKNRGTKIIAVDPRVTRTSAVSDLYAPIRSGTDIAFVNGIINYALTRSRYNYDYIRYYTNGSLLINSGYNFDPSTGFFSGFSGSGTTGTGSYDKSTWAYQTDEQTGADGAVTNASNVLTAASGTFSTDLIGRQVSIISGANTGTFVIENATATTLTLTSYAPTSTETGLDWVLPGIPIKDLTLSDPNCVFNIMKDHYSRYTPEIVEKITGCPADKFLDVAELYTSTGQSDKCGTILYAMGTTQHTYGTQNVRSYAILQLLMGNTGLSGGGINALRGESNVQGSTDMALLFHILPGYLKTPRASNTTLGLDTSTGNSIVYGQDQYDPTFMGLTTALQDEAKASFLWKWTPQNNDPRSANWWQHSPKYMISLLKAFYGDAATAANDFCYDHLGKIDDATNYSHMSIFDKINDGTITGLICWGQNPAVGGPSAGFERRAMAKLDWMVCVDLWATDTSVFWDHAQDASGNDVAPADIDTEVWQLPAAGSYEKEGSVVNSGRWAQWRYKAVDPPGDAKDDAWIVSELVLALQANPGTAYPTAITDLSWPCYSTGDDHVDVDQVAMEINGEYVDGSGPVKNFVGLKADGTTTSGNWLYCGQINQADGRNRLKDRDNSNAQDVSGIGLYSEWSWCWPINRRIIYNRASLRPDTQEPWDPYRAVILVDQDPTSATYKKPVAGDIPDGGWVTDPAAGNSYRHPFIMKPEGHSRLFGMGRADGPLTEHYEPMESPLSSSIVNPREFTPAVHIYGGEQGEFSDSTQYPIVATTYRVTEHWQAGCMTRSLPWLCEMMPYMFIEMSYELAGEKGIVSGDEVLIDNVRGQIRAYAIVTHRFKPFYLDGSDQPTHQIGMPWHFGPSGLATGDSANILTPHVGDCNTRIPEYKAFLCNVTKA
jgi:formate dehydrogenase major subunit